MPNTINDLAHSEPHAIFMEHQRFTQPWLWSIVLIVAGGAWYAAIQQLLLGQPWGTNPASDSLMLVIWIMLGVLMPVLLFTFRLDTSVQADGIHIRYRPFHLRSRCLRYEEIEQMHARTYRPILEYGGWGIRLGFSGWAYNVRGNQGIQIRLRSGNNILIGTQHPNEIIAAVQRARGKPGLNEVANTSQSCVTGA